MEEELYDEFGNYIGPEVQDSDEDEEDIEEDEEGLEDQQHDEDHAMNGQLALAGRQEMEVDDTENRIVLHEDKRYYPEAEEVFRGVRTVVLDEDAQGLEEPIIKPIKTKNFSVLEKEIPQLNYSTEFLTALMLTPSLIRNVAVVGHLHHGKTMFMDTIIQYTHASVPSRERMWDPRREVRYTDTRKDEQERALSIKATPAACVLEGLKNKSYLLNLIDCPGHVNFSDEVTAALRASDGVVLCVDAVEGVMINTERCLRHALEEELPVCVCITKMDRLILELKLPPEDAYFKIVHTLEEINAIIAESAAQRGSDPMKVSPELGNVCFAAPIHGWSFTLESFAQKYSRAHKFDRDVMDPVGQLASRMWGNWWFDREESAFVCERRDTERTFVEFILNPIYKIYSAALGEEVDVLTHTLAKIGVKLKHNEAYMDPKPLLRVIFKKFFGSPKGFVNMCAEMFPDPVQGAESKIAHTYTGSFNSSVAKSMRVCDPEGPLMVNVVKQYNTPDGASFVALGRIFSGKLKVGAKVKVLGEAFSEDDDEDMAFVEVTSIAVPGARYSVEIDSATAGNLVLIGGIDAPIKKTATLTAEGQIDVSIFSPLKFDCSSVMRLAVEPLNPSELPKMVEALRRVNKTYPLAITKVEESGEHVVVGTGELYLDCIMHDVRFLFSDIEVKVADPVVTFCETVVETSAIKCFSETPNKRNRITMIAEPLESGLAEDIEKGYIDSSWDSKSIFQTKYEWDALAARSVWAFGPESRGPNILMDDTLSGEVDKKMLYNIKDSIVQGFQWGCKEGPLCDEPIRNVKFKIIDATIANEPIHRGGGQIIPTARRVAYSAFLMSTPRLMEPVYAVYIQCPADCVQAVYPVCARRRGHVVHDSPKPGAPFYTVKAFLPVIDSFGFETDLRSFTHGQAMCLQVFDHWAVVPGDPLDKSIVLHPLEPSPPPHLAKDFMVKTRRRKGLSEDVALNKYFDDPTLLMRAMQEIDNSDGALLL